MTNDDIFRRDIMFDCSIFYFNFKVGEREGNSLE